MIQRIGMFGVLTIQAIGLIKLYFINQSQH